MAHTEELHEPMPGYVEFAVKTYRSVTEYFNTHNSNVNWVTKWVDDVATKGRYENADVFWMVLLAMFWTALRIFATRMYLAVS